MAKTVFEIDIETAGAVASAKDLREQFNILEDKMFELAAAGKEGTKEFAAIRNQLAGTKERIDDLNESIDMLKPEAKFQAFANLGAGIANGFAAAQGAAQLFGSESEALNESLAKVQAAMALAQGVQGLAGMGDSLKVVGAMLKSTTVGTYLATAAQRVYNAVMAANPVGLLVAGLTALVGVIALVVNAMGDETEALKETISEREKELDLMNRSSEALKNENKFRLDLAAAQGKNAQELAKINEENTKAEIKNIDLRIKENKRLFDERLALMRQTDGEEFQKLQEANSKTLEEMRKLANDRLALQQGLKIQEAKLETDANKEAEQRAKEAADKKTARDLANAEFWRQSEQKFIDYSIEALNNKFGEAEQLISQQRIETRIALGYATPQEIEAYNAFKLKQEIDYQNEVNAELKRLSDEQNKRREENNARIQAEFEAEKKRRDEELAIRKRNSDFAVQSTLQSLNAVQELTDAFAGKSIESQKKAFNVKKAASLAQTTIETYLAAQSAFASQVVPGDPTSPIRGAVAAGLAIASGLARVAVIAKQKFEAPSTGGGGGGGNLGTFSQGGGQPPQGLTAQNTVTQLNPDGTVASQGQRQAAPMKAYVVESESRAVTERVNKLSNNSKIG